MTLWLVQEVSDPAMPPIRAWMIGCRLPLHCTRARSCAGLSLAVLIYISANISGGHLNPAVSLSMAISGNYPLLHSLLYVILQCCGAMVGACMSAGLMPQVGGVRAGEHMPGCFTEQAVSGLAWLAGARRCLQHMGIFRKAPAPMLGGANPSSYACVLGSGCGWPSHGTLCSCVGCHVSWP
jgi:hypothetical protein